MEVFRLEKATLQRAGKVILESIDWSIEKGKVSIILGPTGSGKTSLLRLLNRLDDATSGQVIYQQLPVASWSVSELRKEVGMILQVPYLFEGTVRENILFGASLHGIDVDVEEMMSMVGLEGDLQERDVTALSVGQAQKVSIARAVSVGPRVLLLDEPTASLDPTSTLQIESLTKHLVRSLELTCVFVTHDVEQTRRIGDCGIVLIEGKKVEDGSVARLLHHPSDPRTARFLRGELK